MRHGLLVRRLFIWVGSTFACASSTAWAQMHQDQTASRFPSPGPLDYTNQCTVGDLDNDGDLDIIWANGGGFSTASAPILLRFYINNGSGTFTDGTVAATGGLTFRARGVELGDCDADGDLDVIVANDFNALPALLMNQGPGVLIGTFVNQTATRLPNVTISSSRGQFADVDNDGDLDIMLVNGGATNRFGSGPTKLYINDGLGFYADQSSTRLPAGNISQPMDVIFGDIDGDLDLDVRVVGRAANSSRLWRNNGAGVFTNIGAQPSEANCYSYDFGDMNGDGDLDLLGANAAPSPNTNSELLLSNNGTGVYTPAAPAFPTASIDDNDSKFYDYDNDGDMDVLVSALGGPERAYTNNGTGTYVLQGANVIITSTGITDSSLDIKVADFNSDGRYDIITAQGESGSFLNRIYMNVTGPVDNRVPLIINTEQLANASGVNGPFPVRVIAYDAHTSDRGFHDKGVTLNWRVVAAKLGPPPFNPTPMKWVGNAEWRGVIPTQAASGTVEYYCTVTDWANNTATGPVKSFTLSVPCAADVTGNGVVDIDDLLGVINGWGVQNVTHDVTVQDFEFIPNSIDAKSGDTIRWTWVSGLHTVTSGTPCTGDGKFNTSITSGSPLFQYAIPHSFSGALPYFCTPHCAGGMTASATVTSFPADANGSGNVDIDDLLLVINGWGDCP